MNNLAHLSQRYRWAYENIDKKLINDLKSISSVPYPLAEVLFKRGLKTEDEINKYFNTPLNSLINPFDMKDMKMGADRVCLALKENQLICIYGDYDVDGVTSTSLLYLFFKEMGGRVMHYIPNRLEEGYGLNSEAIEELARKKVDLLITVDCGISAVDEVKLASEAGLDVVVTDHHQAGECLPDSAVAIINPMQEDDTYGFKNLSGVGVAFKLCMAVRHTLRSDPEWKKELPNLKQYLDIVTLGTIADVVPLYDENRTFVIHGLKVLAKGSVRPGIDELKKVAGINNQAVTSYHVGFGLAPRINAVGRLGNSDRGFRLLVTNDRSEARYLASELDQENKFRQGIEREILKQVFDLIDSGNLAEKHRGLVLHSDKWHPGVLGIVASRVTDKYHRPTVILTEENGLFKGSARSIPKFHLYNGLREISDLLISFGGHKYAAGLKVHPDNLDEIRLRFDELVRSNLSEEDYMPEINIDAVIEPADVNDNFMSALQKFEPYGNSNKEPVFCMRNVELYQTVSFVGKTSSHVKCFFTKDDRVLEAIGYDLRIYENLLASEKKFDILFTLAYNNYGKFHNLQLILKDIRAAE